MNKIPEHIIRKIGGRDTGLSTALFYLMKEVGISYKELLEMPMPAIFQLIEELNEHAKREEKAAKRKK
jgi:hypothetical protein